MDAKRWRNELRVLPGSWSQYPVYDVDFGVEQRYVAVEREPETFFKVIEELLTVIDGEFPEPGSGCGTCNYLSQRLDLE